MSKFQIKSRWTDTSVFECELDASLDDADYGARLGSAIREARGSGANLRGANLRGVGIWGATGNLRHLKSIFLDTYQITYTAETLQIGCQRHPIADWWNFTEAQIKNMDGSKAVEWWAKYKPLLQQIIAASPAEPTGYVEKPEAVAA